MMIMIRAEKIVPCEVFGEAQIEINCLIPHNSYACGIAKRVSGNSKFSCGNVTDAQNYFRKYNISMDKRFAFSEHLFKILI